jgi:hypothetical protein
MKAYFEIDYNRKPIVVQKTEQTKSIDTLTKRILTEKIKNNFTILNNRIPTIIENRKVIINLIKIRGQDFYYYSEIEYIPEYRAYEIFNQI